MESGRLKLTRMFSSKRRNKDDVSAEAQKGTTVLTPVPSSVLAEQEPSVSSEQQQSRFNGPPAISKNGSQGNASSIGKTGQPREFKEGFKLTKMFSRRKHVSKPIPPLHAAAFMGDVPAVLEAITSGADVNETIDMDNLQGGQLHGVTALFLATQKNRSKIVKLLVENGADPTAKVTFPKTNEHCSPAQIALLNVNPMMAMYLRKASKRYKDGEVNHTKPPPTPNGRPPYQPSSMGTAALGNGGAPSLPSASNSGGGFAAHGYNPAVTALASKQPSTTASELELPTGGGGQWSSFYMNPGFNMDMRSPELEDDEDTINVNVHGLVNRREHLHNILNESA